MALALTPAPGKAFVVNGFSGPYAPANWTSTTGPGGRVYTGSAPGSISITFNVDDFTNNAFLINALAAGTVSFDWAHTTDELGGDSSSSPFSFYNSSPTPLTNPVLGNQSSATPYSAPLAAGQTFGFGLEGFNPGYQLNSTVTIYNRVITHPTLVPAPLPLLGAAAFGWSRRLRKRIHSLEAKKYA
jgi:hypothetical protein